MTDSSPATEAERACQEAQEALKRAKQIVERSKVLLWSSNVKTVPLPTSPQPGADVSTA